MQRPERFHPFTNVWELKSLTRRLLSFVCLGLALCFLALCLAGCSEPKVGAKDNAPVVFVGDRTATIPQQITVKELAQRIEASDESYWLIDVRTAEEVAIATIPTSTHIPIAQITDGSDIPRIQAERGDRQIILHCYSGVRSRRAQKQLAKASIATTDLKGGIKAWRQQIDPSLPQKLLP